MSIFALRNLALCILFIIALRFVNIVIVSKINLGDMYGNMIFGNIRVGVTDNNFLDN